MIKRRQLLAVGGTVAAGLALAGCDAAVPGGTNPSGSNSAPSGGAVTPPSYIPFEGVTPDGPGNDAGALPYFKTLPVDAPAMLSAPPGSGGPVTTFTMQPVAPVPMERNPRWQAINDMLGVTLNIEGPVPGEYAAKFVTTVAGGELPDIVTVLPSLTSKLPSMLEAKFTDLSEWLSGDAIADFPALANIPSFNWNGSVYNNGIYLISKPHYKLFRAYLTRTDIIEDRGLNPSPASGAELLELMAELSDPKNGKYATANWVGMLDMVAEMMGAPNEWREDAGRFTKDFESEEFAEALGVMHDIWDKEYMHPDAFATSINANTFFINGSAAIQPTPPSWAWIAAQLRADNPDGRMDGMVLPTWEGGAEPAPRREGPATPYRIAIPKTDPERVRELLGVINALSAPFGTAEYNLLKYGVDGVDFSVGDDGLITRTDEGTQNAITTSYLGDAPPVHFSPDVDAGRWEYEQDLRDVEVTVPQAHIGLESETDQADGAALRTQIMDVANGVIQGRNTMDDWTRAVEDWRKNGGDTIRGEYEKAFADANA